MDGDWLGCTQFQSSVLLCLPRQPSGPGRKAAGHKFDFATVTTVQAKGQRESKELVYKAMCEEDFIHFYRFEAPAYQRSLQANSVWTENFILEGCPEKGGF